MSNFTMKIRNVKNIKKLDFDIPTEKGLYALTGENGSGKSTMIASAAASFYVPWLYDYFGEPRENSEITFLLDGKKRIIKAKKDKIWNKPLGNIEITGFYEGSIVYGNRFKDIDYKLINKVSKISKTDLNLASEFVRSNLGMILRDNKEYYSDLYTLKSKPAKHLGLQKELYYYINQGSIVSQLQMSTGENLLLTVLRSLEIRLGKDNFGKYPVYIYLDEIELALHSSAIRRFVFFLKNLAQDNNFVVMFSTHSIEILRSIEPNNVFYIQNLPDGSIDLINPCYPVYATRNLESSVSGHDFIIMVEDELAKQVVDRILRKNRLMDNKRVLVIPVGGWHQVLRFAYDTIRSHLTLSTTRILVILDRDIEGEVRSFLKKERINFSTPPNFLPIKSVEKYLLDNLVLDVDTRLFNDLTNYIFQGKSLSVLINEYKKIEQNPSDKDKDGIKNGKTFYSLLKAELRQIRKEEKDLIDFITDYLFENNDNKIKELASFLRETL